VKINNKKVFLLITGLAFASLFGPGKFCPTAEDCDPPPVKKRDRSVPEMEIGPERGPSLGVKELPRPDGGKDKVYFSVTPESDRRAREQAEKNKLDHSLDALGNVIILGR
jgi:hypothetical protein